jgi:hypothetical protein
MAFSQIEHVSCVISVWKPSIIWSSTMCIVMRYGPWSFSLGGGGILCHCHMLLSQTGGSCHVNGLSSCEGKPLTCWSYLSLEAFDFREIVGSSTATWCRRQP